MKNACLTSLLIARDYRYIDLMSLIQLVMKRIQDKPHSDHEKILEYLVLGKGCGGGKVSIHPSHSLMLKVVRGITRLPDRHIRKRGIVSVTDDKHWNARWNDEIIDQELFTDGIWIWDNLLIHFVDCFNFKLADDFVEHMKKNQWNVFNRDYDIPEFKKYYDAIDLLPFSG